jgi:mannose-6-phosphate isomerase-like protein (cupin superfamily)
MISSLVDPASRSHSRDNGPDAVAGSSNRARGSESWAGQFLDALLSAQLTIAQFEKAVAANWDEGPSLLAAPRTASWIAQLVRDRGEVAGRYGEDMPHLGFASQWLIGTPGKPGAIHIIAPRETHPSPRRLDALNRQPHEHDSGRLALITGGHAQFVFRASVIGELRWQRMPVSKGDLLFWPAGVAHTFDAMNGFSLLSGMASYVSPAADGFSLPVRTQLTSRRATAITKPANQPLRL